MRAGITPSRTSRHALSAPDPKCSGYPLGCIDARLRWSFYRLRGAELRAGAHRRGGLSRRRPRPRAPSPDASRSRASGRGRCPAWAASGGDTCCAGSRRRELAHRHRSVAASALRTLRGRARARALASASTRTRRHGRGRCRLPRRGARRSPASVPSGLANEGLRARAARRGAPHDGDGRRAPPRRGASGAVGRRCAAPRSRPRPRGVDLACRADAAGVGATASARAASRSFDGRPAARGARSGGRRGVTRHGYAMSSSVLGILSGPLLTA